MPASINRGSASGLRLGGAWIFIDGANNNRAIAIVHRWSSSDRARGLRQIRQGRAMSEAGKLIGGAAVAQLRLVAEREQCLLAARGMTRPRDGQRFVEGQICPLVPTRRLGKRAVMANVTAKLRQRNKNLA